MNEFNWSCFTLKIPINATAEKLYWCWATGEGMEYWFLRMCEYKRPDGSIYKPGENIQPGGNYCWRWHGWSDYVTEEDTITECDGKGYLKFTFGKAGNCTIRIYQENEIQFLELVQDEIPVTEKGRHYWHLGCKTGWTFYLANLKSLLEGGIDLRNKDEKITGVLNS